MTELGVLEAIYTARALCRFKPDPVPEALITQVLDAAIRTPSVPAIIEDDKLRLIHSSNISP
jgi:hypothetical protein